MSAAGIGAGDGAKPSRRRSSGALPIIIPGAEEAGPAGAGSGAGGSTHLGTPRDEYALLLTPKSAVRQARQKLFPCPLKPIDRFLDLIAQWNFTVIGFGTFGFVLKSKEDIKGSVFKCIPLALFGDNFRTECIEQVEGEYRTLKKVYPNGRTHLFTMDRKSLDFIGSARFFSEVYPLWVDQLRKTGSKSYAKFSSQEHPEFLVIEMEDLGLDIQKLISDVATVEKLSTEAFPLVVSFLRELLRLHRINIIHGDLTPSNVCVDVDGSSRGGAVCMTDFGNAREPSTEAAWDVCSAPTYPFAKPGLRPNIFGADPIHLWDCNVDYYAAAFGVVLSMILSQKEIRGGFVRTEEWYSAREKRVKDALIQRWDLYDNPRSELTETERFHGKFIIHAFCQLHCLIHHPADLEMFLNQLADPSNFNGKPLYLRAQSFFYEDFCISYFDETADKPVPQSELLRAYHELHPVPKSKESTVLESLPGEGGSEGHAGDLERPLLSSPGSSLEDLSFEQRVAKALFDSLALGSLKRSCFCFYTGPDADPRGYQLPEDISDFERRCLAEFVRVSPSASSEGFFPSPGREPRFSGHAGHADHADHADHGSVIGVEMGAGEIKI